MDFVLIGTAIVVFWLANWCVILFKLLTNIDNLEDGDSYFEQFIKNVSRQEFERVRALATTNPYLLLMGVALIVIGLL